MQYEVVVKTLYDEYSISSKCLMPVGRIIENLVRLPSGDIQVEHSEAFCTYCADDDCPIIKFMPTDKESRAVKATTNVILNVGKLPIDILEIPQGCPLTPEVFINNGALELENNQGVDEIIDPRIEDPENIRRFPAKSLFDANFVLMPAEIRGKCAFCNLNCELNPGYESSSNIKDIEDNNSRDITN